jgi:hypothetical protein
MSKPNLQLVTDDNRAAFVAAVKAKPLAEIEPVNRLSMILWVEGLDGQASHILMVHKTDPETGRAYYDLPTTKKGNGTNSFIGLQGALTSKYGLPSQLVDTKRPVSKPIHEIEPLQGRYNLGSMAYYTISPTPILFHASDNGFQSAKGIHYPEIADFEEKFSENAKDVEIIAMPLEDAFRILTQERGVPIEAFAGIIEAPEIQLKLGLMTENEFKIRQERISELNKQFTDNNKTQMAKISGAIEAGQSNPIWNNLERFARAIALVLT